MQFRPVIALLAVATAVAAAPCDSCDVLLRSHPGTEPQLLREQWHWTPELPHHSALSSACIATASNNSRTMPDEEVIRDSVHRHVLLRLGGIEGVVPASRCTRIVLDQYSGN
ncbi:hypothetical protein BDV37DRAFT_173985 [Aspergillus pseudonomiae]|uniref:Uncharacterized protein n=1 Tax=Aspergillus pseudonomiae TaxID=1506151 RepID=A0A5N7DR86_9EURO|nr:uncharacterized protein BDV37DRAFT_173985 [Aspergillus pseudonomiae]KAE8408539.1 hypothetical protein BDV37DRAFT_173985 [Aspergillus pseudonomiae]